MELETMLLQAGNNNSHGSRDFSWLSNSALSNYHNDLIKKTFISKKEMGLDSQSSKINSQSEGDIQGQKSTEFISFINHKSSLSQSVSPQTEAHVPSRSVPLYLSNQIGRQLSMSLKNGDNQLKLQLKPPELGSLRVEMEVSNNVLKIGMTADRQATKEILLSHVNELKQALGEHGIKVEKVDIQISYNFNESAPDDKGYSANESSGKKGRHGLASSLLDAEDGLEDSENISRNDSSLDLMA
jgi:flagellar hook-length control protein FliK